MARKYQQVWNLLARNEKATLICLNHQPTIKAICSAIYKEKHRNNERRKGLGMPAFGRVNIEQEPIKDSNPPKMRLIVSIAYSGDSL